MADRRFRVVVEPGGVIPILAIGGLFALIAGGKGSQTVLVSALIGALGGPICLICHEFGHIAAARRAGLVPRKVALMWGGAATHLDGRYGKACDLAKVAVAGPLASFGTAALTAPLISLVPFASAKYGLAILMLFNVAVAVASLLPVKPLDGHKLVVALAWLVTGAEERGRALISRLARWCLALDLAFGALLLVHQPVVGSMAAVGAATLFGQQRLTKRG